MCSDCESSSQASRQLPFQLEPEDDAPYWGQWFSSMKELILYAITCAFTIYLAWNYTVSSPIDHPSICAIPWSSSLLPKCDSGSLASIYAYMPEGIPAEHRFVQNGINMSHYVEKFDRAIVDAVFLPYYIRVGDQSISDLVQYLESPILKAKDLDAQRALLAEHRDKTDRAIETLIGYYVYRLSAAIEFTTHRAMEDVADLQRLNKADTLRLWDGSSLKAEHALRKVLLQEAAKKLKIVREFIAHGQVPAEALSLVQDNLNRIAHFKSKPLPKHEFEKLNLKSHWVASIAPLNHKSEDLESDAEIVANFCSQVDQALRSIENSQGQLALMEAELLKFQLELGTARLFPEDIKAADSIALYKVILEQEVVSASEVSKRIGQLSRRKEKERDQFVDGMLRPIVTYTGSSS